MQDGPVRKVIKCLALSRYVIDLAVTRAILRLRGEPRFVLRGACTGCGGCCQTPMVHVAPVCFHLQTTRWLILTWHRVVNGFAYLGEDRATHTFTFRCTHYDPQTRRCDSYASRPGLCRDYPRNLLYDPNPHFIEGCGFYPLAKNAELIRESFKDLDLPPEKRKELERNFRIRGPRDGA
jgi:Fe-S-cluster containining protein